MNLNEHRILITGGTGFLGRFLLRKLRDKVKYIDAVGSKDCDLLVSGNLSKMISCYHINCVFHLAAQVGGIGANMSNPVSFFEKNMMMGMNVIKESYEYGLDKLIFVGTTCGYPKFCKIPFKEEDLFNGFPEETNAPYGIAKRSLLILLNSYYKQYGFKSSYIIPTNLYGPGDHFNTMNSHVIPAIISKVYQAKENEDESITLWGTGRVSRDFLYVDDCCDGLVLALENYESISNIPINLGSGKEVYIDDLTELICEIMEYKGRIIWDQSYPSGQPRRCLDISKAKELLKFERKTILRDGLKKTINWYCKQKEGKPRDDIF